LDPLSHNFQAPVEKFIALIDEIFAAEDDLPPHAEILDLSPELFSTSTTDFSRPLLNPFVIRKLSTLVSKIARPIKRLRLASRDGSGGAVNTPKGKGRMSDVDASVLSRTLKILERSVKAGEDLDPFRTFIVKSDPKTPTKSPGARKLGKVTKKRGKSDTADETPQDVEGGVDEIAIGEDVDAEHGPEEADLNDLLKVFEIARESVFAADCCIALLVSDRLTKQVRGCYKH
jgi:cohesin loading factor subunit SCC2